MPALSFSEALAAAVRIEENGAAFYEEAAQQSFDPSTADVFSKLAALEKEHLKYFAGLAAMAGAREDHFETDPKNEFTAAISALADRSVFDLGAGAAGLLNGRETGGQVVRLAISLEKDSIVFYLGLKNALKDPQEAAKLDEIIKEEMRHITILHELLKKQN
jgi:rubrerythrin